MSTSTNNYVATYTNGQYLSIADSANIRLGSGDFTIETWMNTTYSGNTTCPFAAQYPDGTAPAGSYIFGIRSGVIWFWDAATSNTGTRIVNDDEWHHVAIVRSGSGSNNCKVYVDGSLDFQFTNTTNFTGGAAPFQIGKWGISNATGYSGYMTNLRITRSAVYSGTFTPPTSALTNISNTILLINASTLVDSSSNALSITNNGPVTYAGGFSYGAFHYDASGQGNHWTSNAISLLQSKQYYHDSSNDSPSDGVDINGNNVGNYPVIDLAKGPASTIAVSGGTFFSWTGASNKDMYCTMPMKTGKWYMEVTQVSGADANLVSGFVSTAYKTSTADIVSHASYLGYTYAGRKWDKGTQTNGNTTLTVGTDVLCFAIDLDAGKAWAGKNGSWFSSGDPATGANPYWTFTPNTEYTYGSPVYSATGSLNWGERPFSYTMPAGFKTLNTKSLQEIGAINTPDTYGNFVNTPDLVVIKATDNTYRWQWIDTTRGGINPLFSSDQDAQGTYQSILSFNPGGITLGTEAGVNNNDYNYIGYMWNKGKTPGFDIVEYQGTGATQNIAHSLGQAPQVIITKAINDSTYQWTMYHAGLGAGYCMFLNTQSAANAGANIWNNTTPGNSWFTVGTDAYANKSSTAYIAYLWADVPGFSKFGTYIGSGNNNGTFIYTGFRPRWVMVKNSTTGALNWWINDTARDVANPMGYDLAPNLTNASSNDTPTQDFLSNGFKQRNAAYTGFNASGATYVYMAFAETPFKYANAR